MTAMKKNSQTCLILHPLLRIKHLQGAKHTLADEEKVKDVLGVNSSGFMHLRCAAEWSFDPSFFSLLTGCFISSNLFNR